MKTISSTDHATLVPLFLLEFSKCLHTLENQDSIAIGLSGGTSLLSFYEALKNEFPSLSETLRAKLRFAFLDERIVPLDHADSNYRLLLETLFSELISKGLIQSEQILTVQTDIQNPESDYSERVPTIDIALFGVGPDGHIASLFPNHSDLANPTLGYFRIDDSPKPPASRISVSTGYVANIRFPFVFFMGAGKREAYEKAFDANIPKSECPAKYALASENSILVTDLA